MPGRHYGVVWANRSPWLVTRDLPFQGLITRYDAALIIGIRFMFGRRPVGPIVIGMRDVAAWRFVSINLLGAAIWAA